MFIELTERDHGEKFLINLGHVQLLLPMKEQTKKDWVRISFGVGADEVVDVSEDIIEIKAKLREVKQK